MDILHLVDRLEELFDESRPIWFTHSVMIDEDKILDLIDQMRVSIPEEIKKSQQLLAQSDRIIAKAKEEAANIVSMSKEKSDELSSMMPSFWLPRPARIRSSPRRATKRRIFGGRRTCTPWRALPALKWRSTGTLNQVRNGIQVLQSEKKPASPPQPPPEKPVPQPQ